MQDYSDIGLDSKLRKAESLAGRPREWKSEFEQDVQMEKGAYANPTQIQKGVTDITQGGIINFKDTSGSTILTFDPVTRAVTITSNVIITGGFTVNGTTSSGTIKANVGTIGTLNSTFATVGTAFAGEYQMTGNVGNKIREYFGLCLVCADTAGANAVRIQNSNLTDLIQFQSKGGARFVEQGTPATPDKGLLYFETANGKFKFWNGGAWETITSAT